MPAQKKKRNEWNVTRLWDEETKEIISTEYDIELR